MFPTLTLRWLEHGLIIHWRTLAVRPTSAAELTRDSPLLQPKAYIVYLKLSREDGVWWNYCFASEIGYHQVAQCAQTSFYFLVSWNMKKHRTKHCTINILSHTRNVIIWRVHTMRSTLRLLTIIDLFMFKTRGSYLWCRDQLHNPLVVNQNQLKCTSSSEISRAILTEPILYG